MTMTKLTEILHELAGRCGGGQLLHEAINELEASLASHDAPEGEQA